jgi:hypothetical protein
MIAILASNISATVDPTSFYSAVARPVNHQNRNKKCPDRFCGSLGARQTGLRDWGGARVTQASIRMIGLRESVCIERATPNVENALSSRSALYVYGFGTLIDANPR